MPLKDVDYSHFSHFLEIFILHLIYIILKISVNKFTHIKKTESQ